MVIVGDEILSGRVRDANGPHACAALRRLGVRVRRIAVVPDDVKVGGIMAYFPYKFFLLRQQNVEQIVHEINLFPCAINWQKN